MFDTKVAVGQLTYLAAPYNHGDPTVVAVRHRTINLTTAKMLRMGRPVFSPITHNLPLLETSLIPPGWDFWQPFDELILSRCDSLCVLMLPGWEMSKGIRGELALAAKIAMPISHLHPLGVGLQEVTESYLSSNAIPTLPQRSETLPCEHHCSVCDGSDHHWRFESDADEYPQFVEHGYMQCSHCPAVRKVEDDDE